MVNLPATMTVPRIRVLPANRAPANPDGDYVLYWMVANRRVGWNFALQHAVQTASLLRKPLLVLEALRSDYPHASDRLHRFILQGMADNARRLQGKCVTYYPYVERAPGEGKGLIETLGSRACTVVTDLYPGFFLPRMVAAAARRLHVSLEQVDSCGILPLAEAGGAFPLAHSFRRHLHKHIRPHLRISPAADPLAGVSLPNLVSLPDGLGSRYPVATAELLRAEPQAIGALPIDHHVGAVEEEGGTSAASVALERFLRNGLDRYDEDRNHPDASGGSGLSPWLHFGHLSAHEVVRRVLDHEGWEESQLADKATGAREGWWGVSAPAQAFLDQIITWRELGFHTAYYDPAYASYDAIPAWARATLEKHASDRRTHLYSMEQLASGQTHDRVWNAAQRQLVEEGRLHNYLRMLWGKRILEWTGHPTQAFEVMTELNDRHALDGRDPNSASGISWVLGKYDRPWGPERDVFGTVRYMSSENTMRKVKMARYLDRWAPER